MSNPTLADIHIFRAGRHTAMNGVTLDFSDADLAAAAAAYDPALHEAPIVVGHPQVDAPAYGWVSALAYSDGDLSAHPSQIDPAFADMVRAGRFKKVSASFYLPDSPANPKPGAYYLRHVGFLGAQPPAVKGLKQAAFADGEAGIVEVEFGEAADDALWNRFKSWLAARLDREQANTAPAAAAPAHFSETPHEDSIVEKTPEQLQAEFAERETALKAREDAIATAEKKARNKASADFVETLVNDGKVLPRDQAALTALLTGFAPDTQVAFAEDGAQVKKGAAEVLREFLTHLPPAIDYTEAAPASNGTPVAISFAAPAGAAVDQQQARIFQKAKAYQATHVDTQWIDAVRAVGG